MGAAESISPAVQAVHEKLKQAVGDGQRKLFNLLLCLLNKPAGEIKTGLSKIDFTKDYESCDFKTCTLPTDECKNYTTDFNYRAFKKYLLSYCSDAALIDLYSRCMLKVFSDTHKSVIERVRESLKSLHVGNKIDEKNIKNALDVIHDDARRLSGKQHSYKTDAYSVIGLNPENYEE